MFAHLEEKQMEFSHGALCLAISISSALLDSATARHASGKGPSSSMTVPELLQGTVMLHGRNRAALKAQFRKQIHISLGVEGTL